MGSSRDDALARGAIVFDRLAPSRATTDPAPDAQLIATMDLLEVCAHIRITLNDTFNTFLEKHDLISVESIQAGMMTELRYNISLRPEHRAGELVSAIQQVNGNNRVLLTSAAPNRTLGTE